MNEIIYKVTTEGDVEGRTIKILGYATGKRGDIEAYYQDKKCYAIHLDPITVENITIESANQRAADFKKKKELEHQLEELNKKLK